MTAAAVAVLTARRSGSRLTVRAAADRHGVAEPALGDTYRKLDLVLGAAESTLW